MGKQVGGSWPKQFCKRHPDLKMKKTVGFEKACAKALNHFAVNGFFDMLTNVMKELVLSGLVLWTALGQETGLDQDQSCQDRGPSPSDSLDKRLRF